MEYLIGSLATLSTLGVFVFFLNRIKTKALKIRYSQSQIHKAISPFLPTNNEMSSQKMTQSRIQNLKTNIKVIIIDNSAYWIKDNTFYTAYLSTDGTVDKDTTRIVDTMTMDSVELERMLFIMDKLREGLNNDSGSTGQ